VKPRLALVCLALGLSWPGRAWAMTCNIRAITGLAFGSYNVFSGTALDTTGSIVYRCDAVSLSDSILIQLGRGNSLSGPRKLQNGAAELEYNIYLDAARSVVWGDGSDGSSQQGPTLPVDGAETSVPVYGRLEPRQNARVGNYSDTVVVTIVF
jgi:spore coat protein U domain-containing protein, fimbrial subunit CupE1/2/3/6